ncbi:hypothetical protein DYB37_001665 [Aphanomyces astaci]|uniref:CLASP N-terminal domain-containing protein n=1 Tax=Aphanomyces astaci TaxID=112090 RepID=A0A3R6YNX8_APHAT|nr:hypothetical protein DYB37_001665 [Aphanomyces astaci]
MFHALAPVHIHSGNDIVDSTVPCLGKRAQRFAGCRANKVFRILNGASEARCLIVQQVTTVVRVWPKSELAEHCDDLLLLLTGAIQDPKDFVRAAAREALCAFAETW